jgi:hypothetical protein
MYHYHLAYLAEQQWQHDAVKPNCSKITAVFKCSEVYRYVYTARVCACVCTIRQLSLLNCLPNTLYCFKMARSNIVLFTSAIDHYIFIYITLCTTSTMCLIDLLDNQHQQQHYYISNMIIH